MQSYVTVDKKLGLVVRATVSPWLEFGHQGGASVLEERVLQDNALNAYSRHAPFRSSRLASKGLILGLPWAGEYPKVVTNWLPEHEDLRSRFIAIPLYRVRVVDDKAGYTQWIDVDARSGRVLSIYLTGHLDATESPNLGPIPSSLEVAALCGGLKFAILDTEKTVEQQPQGDDLAVINGLRVLNGVLDESSSLFWLRVGKAWRAYAIASSTLEQLRYAKEAQRIPYFKRPVS